MFKFTFEKIKEYFGLFWTNLAVQRKNFFEYCKVIIKYYPKYDFAKADLLLIMAYFLDSPFRMSKRFLKAKGATNIYTYGETPLTTLEQIAKQCRLSSEDVVYELGSGRGRACFWLQSFIGCKVIGLEYVPEFVERAEKIKTQCQIPHMEFRCQNFLEADYTQATVIYLYGTCLEEEQIHQLIEHLQQLPKGAKVITVSYSLKDYTQLPIFEVMHRFPAEFTWGITDVYCQIKK